MESQDDIRAVVNNIRNIKDDFTLSIGQIAKLVGAPPLTVKRWLDGDNNPKKRYLTDLSLIQGLIYNNNGLLASLRGRGRLMIDPDEWDAFAGLIKHAKKIKEVTKKHGLPKTNLAELIVVAIRGVQQLIKNELGSLLIPDNELGEKILSRETVENESSDVNQY